MSDELVSLIGYEILTHLARQPRRRRCTLLSLRHGSLDASRGTAMR